MAKPPFAVGNKVVSKLKATYGKEGEILQVSGSSRSRKYTIRWSCGTVSTASTKGICHTQGHAPVVSYPDPYVRNDDHRLQYDITYRGSGNEVVRNGSWNVVGMYIVT